MTLREDELAEQNNLLQDVFLNGDLLVDTRLTAVSTLIGKIIIELVAISAAVFAPVSGGCYLQR